MRRLQQQRKQIVFVYSFRLKSQKISVLTSTVNYSHGSYWIVGNDLRILYFFCIRRRYIHFSLFTQKIPFDIRSTLQTQQTKKIIYKNHHAIILFGWTNLRAKVLHYEFRRQWNWTRRKRRVPLCLNAILRIFLLRSFCVCNIIKKVILFVYNTTLRAHSQ